MERNLAGAPSAPFTVRLFVPAEKKNSWGLIHIQKKVLEEILMMPHESIFCLQSFPQQGFYDVTFECLNDMRTCYTRSQEQLSHPDIHGIRFVPHEYKERIPVTVHMYNPFVRDEEIRTFLLRYCKYVSGAERRKNLLGTFNGMRRFWVEFERGSDGLHHPPQNFAIGSNRGFLHYPGQPSFCRDCFAFGHTREDCTVGQVCKNCYKPGHRTADCEEARKCHFCGSSEHLARQCPRVPTSEQRTYSGVVRGESLVVPGPATEVPTEVETVLITQETESTTAPDHLVAEGEEAHVPTEVSENQNEMEVDKASLKRKQEAGNCTPASERIEEFSSPGGEFGGDSSAAVDSDSSTATSSSHEVGFLERGAVKKLARTLHFTKSVEDVIKEGNARSQRGRGGPRKKTT